MKNVNIAKRGIVKEIILGVRKVCIRNFVIKVETFLFNNFEILPSTALVKLAKSFFSANLMSLYVSQSAQKLPLLLNVLKLPFLTKTFTPLVKEFLPILVVFSRALKIWGEQ